MTENYPDDMFEEAARREAENQKFGQQPWDESYLEEVKKKAFGSLDRLYTENGDALKQLAEIEKLELDKMKLTYRQLILLTIATTLFYDEVAKTSTPEMKQEITELCKIIQDEAVRMKND